ncbi:DUF6249 domain-containing protein [Candidatus Latescibacterota bacterium]
MGNILQDLLPFAFFVLVAVFIFMYVMSKQKERMALIDKGVDTSKIYSKEYNHQVHLRNGILLISMAFGLIIGYILTKITNIDTFIAYAASILLIEGIGFLLYYYKNKNLNV